MTIIQVKQVGQLNAGIIKIEPIKCRSLVSLFSSTLIRIGKYILKN
jgi:hypothetical protein